MTTKPTPSSSLPPQLPHGSLEEVLPGLFVVQGQMNASFGDKNLQMSRAMTVVRDDDGLTLLNTLRLDAQGLATLDALGPVKAIVRLGAFHGRDDAFYMARYKAPMWALPNTPHERGVATDKELLPGQPGPCAGSTVFSFKTSKMPEGILHLERHGGVLLSCDGLQNWASLDEWFDAPTGAMMEAQGFIQPANIGPGWLGTCKPENSDFEALRDLDYQHLISAHGVPLLKNAKVAISKTIDAHLSAH